ncbi:putative chloramphenical resistance permease RarD [Slackia heliotrinireducens]|uniref:RarD protein n=2 Tax=Slackia TaxID=84108 RepID=C7N1V9_SLAHD|nr:rarD protein [Slackia heliotrinireducens DSM 20476]VEH02690.1 putative chloramphenical resistance permease RarD [Slackia heliotrinireducens]
MAAGQADMREERTGTLAGLACYILWGLFPLYWKMLVDVNSIEIICHRIIWCFATAIVVCAVLRLHPYRLLSNRRGWAHLLPAALIIATNWGMYIWGVNNGYVVEAALGYYINPLVSVLIGRVAFKERLTPMQCIAVVLCTLGVTYFTVSYGRFPWLAFALAISFGVYGAIKKHGGYPSFEALAVENTITLPIAIGLAITVAHITGTHAFFGDVSSVAGWKTTALLILGGPVTAIPLMLFSAAANKIPLASLGFIQYVSPTLQLIIGVFVFGEPFTLAHAVCFACIWAGLSFVVADAALRYRAGLRAS